MDVDEIGIEMDEDNPDQSLVKDHGPQTAGRGSNPNINTKPTMVGKPAAQMSASLAEVLKGVPDVLVNYLASIGVLDVDVFAVLHDTAGQHRMFWQNLMDQGKVQVPESERLVSLAKIVAAWKKANSYDTSAFLKEANTLHRVSGHLCKVEVSVPLTWHEYADRAKKVSGRLPKIADLQREGLDVGYDCWTPVEFDGGRETGRRDGFSSPTENCWANIGPRKYAIEYPAWGLQGDVNASWKPRFFFVICESMPGTQATNNTKASQVDLEGVWEPVRVSDWQVCPVPEHNRVTMYQFTFTKTGNPGEFTWKGERSPKYNYGNRDGPLKPSPCGASNVWVGRAGDDVHGSYSTCITVDDHGEMRLQFGDQTVYFAKRAGMAIAQPPAQQTMSTTPQADSWTYSRF